MDTKSQEVTPEALVDLPVPHDVRISPDGTKVVYSVSPFSISPIAKSGEQKASSIWIADVGKEFSARQLTSGLFKDSSPQWRPNEDDSSNYIAFVSDRAKTGESSAIYLISLQGGEPYPITETENKKAIDGFKWDPKGVFIAFISPDEKTSEQGTKDEESGGAKVYGENWEYNRLRCVHVATRQVETLFKNDAHIADFTWDKSGHELAYLIHQNPDMNSPGYHGVNFEKVNLSSKERTLIIKETFPGYVEDLVWSSTGSELYFRAGVTPNKSATSSSLYRMSLDDGTWRRSAFGDVNCATGLRKTKGSLLLHVENGLKDELHVSSHESPDSFRKILEIPGEMGSWDAIVTKNDYTTAIVKSSCSSPPELYTQQHPDETMCQLSQHGSAVAQSKIGVANEIFFEASDGTKGDGIFVRPSSTLESSTPMPTVVMIHGGPYGRLTVAFNLLYFYWVPYLVSAGYACLCPNYRGGSSHGEEFASQARGALGTVDYDDIIASVKEGIAQGLIDEERVIIGGYSQGGFLSYLAVTRPDFQFKGAICGAGVTDADMMCMTSDAPFFEAELAGKPPWEADASDTSARHASAIWHMKNVKTPILILHGENDVRVPLTQAVAFHRGCLHYGVPCDFVMYPREGHAIKERKHIVDMLKRIRRFCDLHLKS